MFKYERVVYDNDTAALRSRETDLFDLVCNTAFNRRVAHRRTLNLRAVDRTVLRDDEVDNDSTENLRILVELFLIAPSDLRYWLPVNTNEPQPMALPTDNAQTPVGVRYFLILYSSLISCCDSSLISSLGSPTLC